MSASTIKEYLSRQPFEPFRIVLSRGTIYDVCHPEMAMLLRNGVGVAVRDENGQLPELPIWCSFLHIAAVEPLTFAKSSGGGGNGESPR